MNKLALGTVQFGMKYGIANNSSKFSLKDISKILNLAKQNKILTLDTAIDYGLSETYLGKQNLEDFKIITKLPEMPQDINDIKSWVFNEIKHSLERLNQNKMHAILLHRPSDLLKNNGNLLYKALLKLKEENLVSKIGVSIYAPSELELLTQNFDFDIVQSPFNVFDNRLQESGWLIKLKRMNVEIHARSPFLQGLLLMNKEAIPIKFEKWKDVFNAWELKVEKLGLTKMEACFQFLYSFDQIDKIVFGVDNIEQFIQITKYNFKDKYFDFSNMACEDIKLINPSNWNQL